VELPPPPQAALRRLARRVPLQPALHARVLADSDVEPHPRRALKMWTKDCARRASSSRSCKRDKYLR
jgi:hypothetical protein